MSYKSTAEQLFENDIHPRILFGPDDIPLLRDKITRGIPCRAFREMIRRCEAWEKGMPDKDPMWAKHAMSGRVMSFAFAYMLTAEDRWKNVAVNLLMEQAGKGVVDRHGHSAIAGYAFPLAYDMMHGALSEGDRALAEDRIRNEINAFQRDYLGHPEKYVWLLGANPTLASLLYYPFWLAAVYRQDTDRAAMEELADLIRSSIHLGVDESGTIGEGPNYGEHDAVRWVFPSEILRRVGIANLWEEEPRMRNMIRHWAYLALPGRKEFDNRCDSGRKYGIIPLWSHLLLARSTGDAVIQWIWEELGGRGHVEGHGDAPECFGPLEFIILWEDDDAEARNPGEDGWPLSKEGGVYGENIMRSGWDADAMYFSMQASGRSPGCLIHQHIDAGHFSLYALGEAFSVESGYGDILGRHHSVLMPMGQEPPTGPTGFDQAWTGGHTEAFASTEHADYCRVNIGEQWDCRWYYRHALVIRAPGADPYVLLLDNANYRGDYATYDWLINSEPGNRICLDQANIRAVIQGVENRMEVVWSYPRPKDYPTPHQIDLYADEINSTPLDHVKIGLRLGMGIRPRLRAELRGYNGLLLSALIPRRSAQAPVVSSRITGPMQFGLVIEHGKITDTVVVSPVSRLINIGGMRGEATLAVARHNSDGGLMWAAAADAFALNVGGHCVLARRGTSADLIA